MRNSWNDSGLCFCLTLLFKCLGTVRISSGTGNAVFFLLLFLFSNPFFQGFHGGYKLLYKRTSCCFQWLSLQIPFAGASLKGRGRLGLMLRREPKGSIAGEKQLLCNVCCYTFLSNFYLVTRASYRLAQEPSWKIFYVSQLLNCYKIVEERRKGISPPLKAILLSFFSIFVRPYNRLSARIQNKPQKGIFEGKE